jgi:shikimate 5-dehydrogenase
MLIAQASCQFEWWTGRRAPAAVIEAGARAGIQGAQAAA